MKKMLVQDANGRRGVPLLWIVLGVVAVAALSAAPWGLPARPSVEARRRTGGDLRKRTAELIGYASSIRLTPEQEKVKAAALSAIPALCCNRNSPAAGCCGCNLFKSIRGLANHMIARERADASRVRQAVLDWIGRTNPGGHSGGACDSKRFERPFRADGYGGMSEARLIL